MKSSLTIALSLCAVACAHREPVEHTTVSAVGNEDLTHDRSEPDNQKMRYTEISREDALNRPRDQAEYAQTHEGRSGAQVAASAPAQNREACEMNVYFPTASAQLDDRAKQQLDAIATCLKRTHNEDTLVVGSADPRGSEQDNAALGEERARRVAQYLKALGVPESEIRVRSVGEREASAAPDTWPASRRAKVQP